MSISQFKMVLIIYCMQDYQVAGVFRCTHISTKSTCWFHPVCLSVQPPVSAQLPLGFILNLILGNLKLPIPWMYYYNNVYFHQLVLNIKINVGKTSQESQHVSVCRTHHLQGNTLNNEHLKSTQVQLLKLLKYNFCCSILGQKSGVLTILITGLVYF